jgi:hypothetical protein
MCLLVTVRGGSRADEEENVLSIAEIHSWLGIVDLVLLRRQRGRKM